MDACGEVYFQRWGHTSAWLSRLVVLRGTESRRSSLFLGGGRRRRLRSRCRTLVGCAKMVGRAGVDRLAVRQEQSRLKDNLRLAYGSELLGFAERVASANAGKERKAEFLPFMVGDDLLGYVHYRFARHLKRFPEVFLVGGAAGCVRLAPCLPTLERRTVAVQTVLKALRSEGLIPGWRNELLPVTVRYEVPPVLLMERAAVQIFGAKNYGIHLNGFVNIDGVKHLWIGQRSDSKPTFPGMLDPIVAGAQPEGVSAMETVIKECDEEAGIPSHLAEKAVAAGSVSCEYTTGDTITRDVLFTYDLELPENFTPCNRDGEVQRFYRLPVSEVYDIISHTDHFKPNSAVMIIDFFFRWGWITPEQKGYLALLQSLRTGEL